MIKGRITKGVGGLYFVDTGDGVISCKPKGIFRKDGKKPLVGDYVEVSELPDGTGQIVDIVDRINSLIRPEVANASQAMLVFAVTSPKPSLNLADRFLINMEKSGVSTILVFNKADIATPEEIEAIKKSYVGTGYSVYFISAKNEEGTDELKALLHGKTTVLAGPSGVGKSTLVNILQSQAEMQTGTISERIMRGKHTTRHSEVLRVDEESFIIDTPGFTSFDIFDTEPSDLFRLYPEMKDCDGMCRFTGCAHINEPDCEVKNRVKGGLISKTRYENYKLLYTELKNRKKY